jgi:hypothetical protein
LQVVSSTVHLCAVCIRCIHRRNGPGPPMRSNSYRWWFTSDQRASTNRTTFSYGRNASRSRGFSSSAAAPLIFSATSGHGFGLLTFCRADIGWTAHFCNLPSASCGCSPLRVRWGARDRSDSIRCGLPKDDTLKRPRRHHQAALQARADGGRAVCDGCECR